MARIEVQPEVQRQLARLGATRALPPDTFRRVGRRVRRLARYPLLGRPLAGRFAGHRALQGPWPWMVVLYRYDEARDAVIVVSIQDTRTEEAWTGER